MTASNGHVCPERTERIGIVGGGFSGAAMVYHLARAARGRLDITLYEPRERVGHGVAYLVYGDHLLLNVPAGKLSIDPDRPTDFLEWCLSRGRRADAGAFLPRSWFGAYAEARMSEQVRATRGAVTLRCIQARVDHVVDDGDELQLVDTFGGVARVTHAVLALGHGPTKVPEALAPVAGMPQVLRTPWDRDGMARIAGQAERILLVGTGLTMCDAAITLARLGFKGEMTAISRRGLLPEVHGPSDPASLTEWHDHLASGSVRTLCREIRTASRIHGWRSAMDALRPRTHELWAALSSEEQFRFMGRLVPYWDTHRHRLPPECAEAIRLLRRTGSLRVLRGSIRRVTSSHSRLTCEFALLQHRSTETLHADAIVLCTGPEPDPRLWNSPLIDRIMADGLATPEVNGLDLRTTNSGHLIGSGAVVQHRLSTIGPLRRGSMWESTAVPEISVQAARLGRLLADMSTRSASGRRLSVHASTLPTPDL